MVEPRVGVVSVGTIHATTRTDDKSVVTVLLSFALKQRGSASRALALFSSRQKERRGTRRFRALLVGLREP